MFWMFKIQIKDICNDILTSKNSSLTWMGNSLKISTIQFCLSKMWIPDFANYIATSQNSNERYGSWISQNSFLDIQNYISHMILDIKNNHSAQV